MANWNPTQAPFRAMWVEKTNAPGLHGWRSNVVGCFATEAEAVAALWANAPKASQVHYGVITVAHNAATWTVNGSWRQVGAKVYPPKLHNGHVIAYRRAQRAAAAA